MLSGRYDPSSVDLLQPATVLRRRHWFGASKAIRWYVCSDEIAGVRPSAGAAGVAFARIVPPAALVSGAFCASIWSSSEASGRKCEGSTVDFGVLSRV